MLEFRCQPVLSFVYTLTQIEGSGIRGMKGIRRTQSGISILIGDPGDTDETTLNIIPYQENESTAMENGLTRDTSPNSVTLQLNIHGMKFPISLRSESSLISRISDLWSRETHSRYILFPFPSYSSMTPFMRFLCMSHNLSGASPVSRIKLIDNSVAEMSIMTVDESREQIRRACQSTLSMMLSSGTIRENRYGVHIPRNFHEYSRRYRRKFIPYHERLMKNTLFDFEK